MSPENQGVFPAPERGEFSKNSAILLLTKMGLFLGAFVRGSVRSDWLVEQVQQVSARKRCDNRFAWPWSELRRLFEVLSYMVNRSDSLDFTVAHNYYTTANFKRFFTIMCDIEKGETNFLLKSENFFSEFEA